MTLHLCNSMCVHVNISLPNLFVLHKLTSCLPVFLYISLAYHLVSQTLSSWHKKKLLTPTDTTPPTTTPEPWLPGITKCLSREQTRFYNNQTVQEERGHLQRTFEANGSPVSSQMHPCMYSNRNWTGQIQDPYMLYSTYLKEVTLGRQVKRGW